MNRNRHVTVALEPLHQARRMTEWRLFLYTYSAVAAVYLYSDKYGN